VDLDHQLVGYLQCLTKEEEEEEEVEGGVPVTIAMVKAWVRDVTQDGSLEGMKSIVSALHAGVLRMAGQNTGEQVLQFRVEDGEVFNTLLVATLKHLNSFLDNFLKLKKNTGRVNPTSSSEWTRVKIPMKTYTSDLITVRRWDGGCGKVNTLSTSRGTILFTSSP
jgi:hypothetical protein